MTIVNYSEFFEMAHVRKEIPNLNALLGKNKDGATEKQKAFLRQLGIGTTGLKYKGQISIVIDVALARKNKGLATPGQMRALCKVGMRDVHDITFVEAKKTLARFQYID